MPAHPMMTTARQDGRGSVSRIERTSTRGRYVPGKTQMNRETRIVRKTAVAAISTDDWSGTPASC